MKRPLTLGVMIFLAGLVGILSACREDSQGGSTPPASITGPTSTTATNPSTPIDETALENSVFERVNRERTSRNLSALVQNDDLAFVALNHSSDMVERDFFAHVNPDGEDGGDRLTEAGVAGERYGENIGRVRGAENPADYVVGLWMESESHRATILTEDFIQTGVGVALDSATGDYYITQLFIQPR